MHCHRNPRVIMLTEQRGMKQVDVLLRSPLMTSDRSLVKIFKVIERDEPSHWAPYEDWLVEHSCKMPSRAERHALVERQLSMLTELAEIGMTIARQAGRWALAAGEGAAPAVAPSGFRGDPGLVYARVARAVRLTLMLQTRLLKDLPALARAETLVRIDQAQSRRERAHRLTMRAIRAEHDEADTVEELSDEAWDRLRDEDLSGDLGDRPLGEVVARICRDLGLSPNWGAGAFPSPSCSDPARRSPGAPARSAPEVDDSPGGASPPSFFACDENKGRIGTNPERRFRGEFT